MRARFFVITISSLVILFFVTSTLICGDKKFKKLREYSAAEARQGVAVDKDYFYVIGTQEIARYDKTSGKLLNKWEGKPEGPIIHLDSGVIVDGLLYCAHSNYPGIPMTSSVEIWDAATLEHVRSFSFGIQWGSCTWIDRHDGYWWAGFAHYGKWKEAAGTDERWTTVVKFDDDWRRLEAWVFPKEVTDKFIPMSNSGGSWGPDNLLYCTGHDLFEIYVLKIPDAGSILELVQILPIDSYGQGIAWDRSEDSILYGIIKKDKKIIVSKLIE